MNLLDNLSALLNTPLLSGAPGLIGITAGRTLTALVCLVCGGGIAVQVKRAWPHLRLLVQEQTIVPLPARRLLQALTGFVLLLLLWMLFYAGQAASTYYSAKYTSLQQRDVVVTLTVFSLGNYVLLMLTALLLSWISVVIADVVTGDRQPVAARLRRRAAGGKGL